MFGKIIDWEVRGCCIKFYLGNHTEEYGWLNPKFYAEVKSRYQDEKQFNYRKEHYYGDDWNDAPYEHNAGEVYEEFVSGINYHYYPFDTIILEPNYNELNSPYCKDDFVAKKVPCVIVIEDNELWEKHQFDYSYKDWSNCKDKGLKKFYFGDELQVGTYFKNDKQTGMFII